LGVEIDPARASLEVDNSKALAVEPFLTGRTGSEIVTTFEQLGLRPAGPLRSMLVGHQAHDFSEFDKRYGSSFSEMTRELSKFINDPYRSLDELFEVDDATSRAALLSIDPSTLQSAPARTFISLWQHALSRDPAADQPSSVPVHRGQVSMKRGGCKDVEYYYDSAKRDGGLSAHDVDGVRMIHKSSGEKTAINLEPITYMGVELPAGCVFQIHGSSYTLIRLTSFCFDTADARDAFTWQYDETLKNGARSQPSTEFMQMLRDRFGNAS
jgi:hypothetical protein